MLQRSTRRERQMSVPPKNTMQRTAKNVKEEDEKKKMIAKSSAKVSKFTSSGSALGAGIIFMIIWFALGFFGFFMSLFCAGFRKSSVTDKTVGILTAMVMGPFYWLFFYFNKEYCKK